MSSYIYNTLYHSCQNPPDVNLSNTKFITPDVLADVYPKYKPFVSKNVSSHFSEKNSSDPKLWGVHLWQFLHYSVKKFPEHPNQIEISLMKSWISSLPIIIPCETCKRHYKEYIDASNLDSVCSSRMTLFNFMVDIHNAVNTRLGKPVISHEEAWSMY
jgi:hypothetical protein